MRTTRPVALLVIVLATLSFGIAGCSGGQGDSSTKGLSAPAPEGSAGLAQDKQMPADGSQPTSQRKEIVTGSVYLTTKDPIGASHRATTRVETLGGRVDQRTEYPQTADSRARSQLVVRVPADKTDQFINELSDYGTVTNISVSRNDVTMQHQDLSARIKALQTSVDRLQTLLANATATSDLIEIETALSQRQADLDSLNAQLRGLNDQIDLSTLTLDFSTVDQGPPSEPDSFWSGLVAGWHELTSTARVLWVGLGRVTPFLAVFAVIGLGIWGIVRKVNARKPKRVPVPAPRPSETNANNGPDQAQ
ncbi:MAG: DUF4349 domain-containing protein [Nocardiaceae bacterium]|nr:DUF4349 domain-containing protein [Nocardiaceae bacterium]